MDYKIKVRGCCSFITQKIQIKKKGGGNIKTKKVEKENNSEYKIEKWLLNQRLNLTLEQKIKYSKQTLEEALDKYDKKGYLSFSGGG